MIAYIPCTFHSIPAYYVRRYDYGTGMFYLTSTVVSVNSPALDLTFMDTKIAHEHVVQVVDGSGG